MELKLPLFSIFCFFVTGTLSQHQQQPWGKLGSAVQEIIHPLATPTIGMIETAIRQEGLPGSFAQMMEYLPHMVQLANRLNVKPPGTNGTVTQEQMRRYIVQRASQWMQKNGIGGMLPARPRNRISVSNTMFNRGPPGAFGMNLPGNMMRGIGLPAFMQETLTGAFGGMMPGMPEMAGMTGPPYTRNTPRNPMQQMRRDLQHEMMEIMSELPFPAKLTMMGRMMGFNPMGGLGAGLGSGRSGAQGGEGQQPPPEGQQQPPTTPMPLVDTVMNTRVTAALSPTASTTTTNNNPSVANINPTVASINPTMSLINPSMRSMQQTMPSIASLVNSGALPQLPGFSPFPGIEPLMNTGMQGMQGMGGGFQGLNYDMQGLQRPADPIFNFGLPNLDFHAGAQGLPPLDFMLGAPMLY